MSAVDMYIYKNSSWSCNDEGYLSLYVTFRYVFSSYFLFKNAVIKIHQIIILFIY